MRDFKHKQCSCGHDETFCDMKGEMDGKEKVLLLPAMGKPKKEAIAADAAVRLSTRA